MPVSHYKASGFSQGLFTFASLSGRDDANGTVGGGAEFTLNIAAFNLAKRPKLLAA